MLMGTAVKTMKMMEIAAGHRAAARTWTALNSANGKDWVTEMATVGEYLFRLQDLSFLLVRRARGKTPARGYR